MRIQRKRFVDDLVSVQPGLSLKGTSQQSESYLFKDGCIYTYNGQVWCCCACDLDLPDVAVPGQNLVNTLEKWDEEEIVVSVADSKITFTGKNDNVTHRITHPVEKIYPQNLSLKIEGWKPLPEDFLQAVETVSSCAQPEGGLSVLPQYGWVHLHPQWIEASDNIQVCRWSMKMGFDGSVFVQASHIKDIVPRGMVSVSNSGPSWIYFNNGKGLTIGFMKYTGEPYPDFTRVLSSKGEKISFPKELSKEVKLAKDFCDKGEIKRVEVTLKKGAIRIKGKGNVGVYESHVPCTYDGPLIGFSVSPAILVDVVERHSECLLSPGRLVVSTPKYTWLGMVHDD